MTNDKGAEFEKAKEIAFANWSCVETAQSYTLIKDIAEALAEARAAGRAEDLEGSAIKETIAYKCGYDSGRSELLAEVVSCLDGISPARVMSCIYKGDVEQTAMSTIRYAKSALLAKLNAEGEK